MPKLILQLSDGEERIVPLHTGEAFTLGRDDRHAIAVNERTVSRRHARLTRREDGACFVEDLQSANGTTLNGAPVARPEPLQDGDRLGFGKVAAIYLTEEATRPPVPKVDVGDFFAGRYQLEKSLGETDEYETFRATDTSAAAGLVAVTVFLPAIIAGGGGFDDVRQRFARVRAAPPHPGLVRLLDFSRWRGSEYLTAEWIEGRPLLDLLRRRGAVPLSGALRLASQVAAVTDHARAHGLPTLDLAPRAVLIAPGESLSPAAWEQTLDAPPEHWPTFTLKITPRFFAPAVKMPWPLGALLCDLLGYPPTGPGTSPPARIACLGERGNAILMRRFAPWSRATGGDSCFVAELAEAVGLSAVTFSAHSLDSRETRFGA